MEEIDQPHRKGSKIQSILWEGKNCFSFPSAVNCQKCYSSPNRTVNFVRVQSQCQFKPAYDFSGAQTIRSFRWTVAICSTLHSVFCFSTFSGSFCGCHSFPPVFFLFKEKSVACRRFRPLCSPLSWALGWVQSSGDDPQATCQKKCWSRKYSSWPWCPIDLLDVRRGLRDSWPTFSFSIDGKGLATWLYTVYRLIEKVG